MKKLLICILAAMPLLFTSCENSNEVKNSKEDVGEEHIAHVGDYVGYASPWYGYAKIYDGSMECVADYISIASVGKVSSLKAVNYVPTSGWQKNIGITVGHGYVVKIEGRNDYSRIRILERIEKGGAIGYRIRVQDGWDPLKD